MIENAVENDSYAVFVELVADEAERVVIAETAVDLFVIHSIIAVFN